MELEGSIVNIIIKVMDILTVTDTATAATITAGMVIVIMEKAAMVKRADTAPQEATKKVHKHDHHY